MFLIWEGLGGLLAFGAVVLGAVILGGTASMGVPDVLAFLLAFAAMSTLLWRVGRLINDPALDQTLIDADTGETVVLRMRHTLFWIPIQWYAVVPVVLAVSIVAEAVLGL